MESKIFTLDQLIDVALNTPEVGVVNFKVLRTVLKVIVRELDIHDFRARVLVKDLQENACFMTSAPNIFTKHKKSDFISPVRSKDTLQHSSIIGTVVKYERQMIISDDHESSLNMQEHEYEEDGLNEEMESLQIENATNKTVLEEESNVKSGISNLEELDFSTKTNIKDCSVMEEESLNEIDEHEIESVSSEQTISCINDAKISDKSFEEPETFNVEKEKKIPSKESSDVLSDTYCSGRKWMVGNMWQSMNFSKRIDAMESGIDKIVGVLDTHARTIDKQRRDFEKKKKENEKIFNDVEKHIMSVAEWFNVVNEKLQEIVIKREYLEMKDYVEKHLSSINQQLTEHSHIIDKIDKIVDGDKRLVDAYELLDVTYDRIKFLEDNTGFTSHHERGYDLATLGNLFDEFVQKANPIINKFGKDLELDEMDKANIMEQLMNVHLNIKQVTVENKTINENFSVFKDEFSKQNENIKILMDYYERGFTPEDKEEFQLVQSRLKDVEKDCQRFILIEELQSSISMLKATKANKIEVDYALASKAEIRDVEDKVNKEEYENMVKETNKSMNEIISSITNQEEVLNNTSSTLIEQLENKSEKAEVENLSAMIENKLKGLAIRMKQLQSFMEWETPIPAGTKTHMAKCISCERPVKKATSFLKSTPASLKFDFKLNMKPMQIIRIGNTNYASPSECNHIKRPTGGQHTIIDPDTKGQKLPEIRDELIYAEKYREKVFKSS
ncbi:interaptin-like [Centruroides vittatus]|uniref:interaptin-like n=1 Tax=Centruroides vittatus TaxID=120091 RepID=UPI00350FD569